jgi:hypothetical protein
MPEPTRPRFGEIPDAPADGYVIETGAAAGMRSHLTAQHLAGVKCHICHAGAEQGTDGRLRIEHKWGPHHSVGSTVNAGAIMAQPLKRDDEPKRSWWDGE